MAEPSATTQAPVADLVVDIVSDVVCPWCYIGKRKLESALTELQSREPGLAVLRRWHPFQLNPDLPAEGIARAAYLEAKFGGKARAAEIYARVRSVGKDVGIPFDFDRIERQPNTLEAHRLIAWAQNRGDAKATDALVEQLFRAYFIEGRLLTDAEQLVSIAQRCGVPRGRSSRHARVRRGPVRGRGGGSRGAVRGHQRRAVFHFQRQDRGVGRARTRRAAGGDHSRACAERQRRGIGGACCRYNPPLRCGHPHFPQS